MKKIRKGILLQEMNPELKQILYSKNKAKEGPFIYSGKKITLSEDPMKLPEEFDVEPIEDYSEAIPLIGYGNSFRELDHEQKYIYTQLLCEPFDGCISVEYVYLLYQALERKLFTSDINAVFDIIIKLRDIYQEPSTFRNYSARVMLFMSAIMKNKALFDKVVSSFKLPEDFAYVYYFYFYAKYMLNIPFDAKDLMMLASKFGFNNKTYINKYPEIFEEYLNEIISQRINIKGIPVKDCVNITEHQTTKHINPGFPIAFSPFANKSISCEGFKCEITDKGKENVSLLLQEAHNLTKLKISELRRSGMLPEIKSPQKRTVTKRNDVSETALGKMEHLLINAVDNAISAEEKYEACCKLCEHYYKYRKQHNLYGKRCIDYCKISWELIPIIEADNQAKKEEEKKTNSKLLESYVLSGDEFMIKIVKSALDNLDKKYSFTKIVFTFGYAITVLKEKGLYEEALKVCDKAIKHYRNYPKDNKMADAIATQRIEYFNNERKAIGEIIR